MTLTQAAERLGVDPATLRQQALKIPPVLRARKLGHIWIVSERELARYAREHHNPKKGRKPKKR